jgi:alpha-L-rhamnosidase
VNQGLLTTGYPTLELSGGKGASIQATYLEALYENTTKAKGDRTKTDGKLVLGVHDIFLPDGGAHRIFEPLWIRNWRYIELDITTAAEPLTLHDYRSRLCINPAPIKAVFESDRPMLASIWDAGWRTLQLGAQDVYVSDLYWERIQYVGDTKLHALAHLAMTGDDRLYRQAIEQIDSSRAPFGLTQSRYPADLEQYTPLYSLVWVTMVHDYWMYRGDDAFVRGFLPGITQVLGWFERQLNADGMLEPLFHLDFVDSNYGRRWQAIRSGSGSKSMTIHTLFFAWTLDQAAELYDQYGDANSAARCRALSAKLKQAVRERCWDAQRKIFSDTPEMKYYSQQANVMAVLTNLVPAAGQPALLQGILDDPSILPCQLYFRFYLGRALHQTGLADRYVDNLKPWEDMIRMGMTTFGESEGNPRSECHPWAATPNYELLSTVAGIEPASPGFRSVRIAPAPGSLRHIHAVMPHPAGNIEVTFDHPTPATLTGRITLPPGLTGVFVWQGKETPIPAEGLTVRE